MEQTKKSGSYGSLRSKFLMSFLLCCALGLSQSSDFGAQKNLSNSFSGAALEVYKANSLEKVSDFYHYLNLLSLANNSALETQLKENIVALFEDRNVLVEDFTTSEKKTIPLVYLIENICSKDISFTIKNQMVTKSSFNDYWINSYTLEITSHGNTFTIPLQQKIFMKPELKNFGSHTREVWQTSLGGIEKL